MDLSFSKLNVVLKKAGINFFLLLISVYFSFVIVDFGVQKLKIDLNKKRTFVPADGRTKFQVVQDLRKDGLNAMPAYHPAHYLQMILRQGEYYKMERDGKAAWPLAGVALSPTVYGIETEGYLIFQSDEHGFHNPAGAHKNNRPDVVLLGDSFTQGASVPSENNLGALLRRENLSVLNLGIGGNGPLMELASYREYAAQKQPHKVVWLFFEGNDISDLEAESKMPILMKYLDSNFSQNLRLDQSRVDKLILGFINLAIEKGGDANLRETSAFERAFSQSVLQSLKLNYLRSVFLNAVFFYAVKNPYVYEVLEALKNRTKKKTYQLFEQILLTVKKEVEQRDGELIFAYIPDGNRFIQAGAEPEKWCLVPEPVKIAENLGIAVADGMQWFCREKHAGNYYADLGGVAGHFNSRGYHFYAQKLLPLVLTGLPGRQ